MKGIILAGGSGTRLYPMTKVMAKQLQPVYDKPMIYYPLSLLMLGGIREILIITTPQDLTHFQNLLGDGSQLGISLSYREQASPNGLPEAFILGEDFIRDDDVCLILGDNIFYGDLEFFKKGLDAQKNGLDQKKAWVFACNVANPERYGVIEFSDDLKSILSIEEKPLDPKSHYVLPGLYIFDSSVASRAKKLLPSQRGETEIVELILSYQLENHLGVEIINRGITWLDAGTPRSLLEAASFIEAIEERQGVKVACLEEIAFHVGFINECELEKRIHNMPNSSYRNYLVETLRRWRRNY